MRYFTCLLLLLAFGLMLPACAQKATTTTQKVKAKNVSKKAVPPAPARPAAQETPVITFERTPCFGTCPAFSMQVFADGRVLYEGRRGVPFVGKKELTIAPAAVADLLRQAKESHFDQFEERYSRNTSDLPSTIIGVKQATGQLKKVAVEEGEPANVRQLVTYFARQLDPLAQVGMADR